MGWQRLVRIAVNHNDSHHSTATQLGPMPWWVLCLGMMHSMANEVFGGLREECERFVEGRTDRAPAHFINPSSCNMIFQYLP